MLDSLWKESCATCTPEGSDWYDQGIVDILEANSAWLA